MIDKTNVFVEIILADILKNNSIRVDQLAAYEYHFVDGAHWLACPFIVRKENEALVYAWKYIIDSDLQIISSVLFDRGENKTLLWSQEVMPSPFDNLVDLCKKIEQIFTSNKQIFIDPLFSYGLQNIFSKYSLEVVQQKVGFRLRVRPYLQESIKFDIFYQDEKSKIIVNSFCPDLT